MYGNVLRYSSLFELCSSSSRETSVFLPETCAFHRRNLHFFPKQGGRLGDGEKEIEASLRESVGHFQSGERLVSLNLYRKVQYIMCIKTCR